MAAGRVLRKIAAQYNTLPLRTGSPSSDSTGPSLYRTRLSERVAAEIPVPDTGDVLADMRTFLTGVVTLFTDDNFGPHLGALIGEAQHDPAVRAALLEQYLKPRRAAVADRLRLAQRHRQLPGELDLTAVLEVMFGALYHRLLLRNGPLDQAYAHFVADMVLGGCSAQPVTDRSHHQATQRQ